MPWEQKRDSQRGSAPGRALKEGKEEVGKNVWNFKQRSYVDQR